MSLVISSYQTNRPWVSTIERFLGLEPPDFRSGGFVDGVRTSAGVFISRAKCPLQAESGQPLALYRDRCNAPITDIGSGGAPFAMLRQPWRTCYPRSSPSSDSWHAP